MSVEGKVAIVTGASQGIGEATSSLLIQNGAKVALADINEPSAIDDNAIFVRADMTVPADIEAMVETTVSTLGRVDILVNNASNVAALGAADGNVVDTDLNIWDTVYACNLRGPAAACKYAIPHMINAGGGAIVNVASVQGLAGDLTRVAYGSMKAGLIMLTKYVATAYGRQNIRCNSVAPGLVMSPPAYDAEVAPFLDIVRRHMPLDRRGQPNDLAEVIYFLLSDGARYITGQNITADGGLTSHQPVYGDLMSAAEQ